MKSKTMTAARLQAHGTYLGFDEKLNGYLYSWNNHKYLWNGNGVNKL